MTIHDFAEQMKTYGVAAFSNVSIKQKLIEKNADSISFIQKAGRSSVILLDLVKHSIIDDWYENRHEDVTDEEKRIVKMAAKLIRVAIKKHDDCTDFYPSLEEIKNENSAIPDLLDVFF